MFTEKKAFWILNWDIKKTVGAWNISKMNRAD
jgi:hypothetical protein